MLDKVSFLSGVTPCQSVNTLRRLEQQQWRLRPVTRHEESRTNCPFTQCHMSEERRWLHHCEILRTCKYSVSNPPVNLRRRSLSMVLTREHCPIKPQRRYPVSFQLQNTHPSICPATFYSYYLLLEELHCPQQSLVIQSSFMQSRYVGYEPKKKYLTTNTISIFV